MDQRMEFHNAAGLEKTNLGMALQRFPKNVRNQLGHHEHERGRFYSMVSTCCEIRFVTDAPFFRIALSSLETDSKVLIYKGDFFHSVHTIPAGTVTTLHVETPPRMQSVESNLLDGHSFSTDVWRVIFGKDSCGIFCGLDTFGHKTRPPKGTEKPALKWLAYGSSITFGSKSSLITNSYVMQAARHIRADVFNKAISGSCFCDPCISDYFSTIKSWNLATLELGINMVGRFTEQEFEQRALSLVNQLLTSNPGKPVVLITPFPAHYQFAKNKSAESSQNFGRFCTALERIQKNSSSQDLFILSGSDILTDVGGLTTDLLHPSDDGHILMGFRLGERLKIILKRYFPDYG